MLSVYADGKRIHLSANPDDLTNKAEMHMMTYRKDVLDKVDYQQTEGISYTDQEWTFYPMTGVNSISYIPLDIYVYMLDRSGQTMDMAVEVNKVSDKMVIAKRMIDYVKNVEFEELSKESYIRHRFLRFLRLIYKLVLLYQTDEQYRSHLSELESLDTHVRSNLPDIYEAMNAMTISSEFPLKFIKRWREKHRRYPHIVLQLHKQLKHLDIFLRKVHLRGS